MKKYKFYLFDFDGTLFNTLDSLIDVFVNSYKSIGCNAKKEDCLRYSRIPLMESFKELNADINKIDIFEQSLRDNLKNPTILNKIKIFDDTIKCLEFIHNNNFKCGIVTSNSSDHVKNVLKHFNISTDIFSCFVGCDECKESKPSPLPIQCAIKHFNIDLNDICYVGDAINDAKAAINAGVTPILLDRNNEFKKDKKYILINSLLDLFD